MDNNFLRIVVNDNFIIESPESVNNSKKQLDHEKLLLHYIQSRTLRNHSEETIYKAVQTLKSFAQATGKFWWEIRVEDVNEYHQSLVDKGLAISTRRGYINIISNFFEFILAHPELPQTALEMKSGNSVERVDWKYKVKLIQPVDRWFKPEHVCDDISTDHTIPTLEELRKFFAFIRNYADSSNKPAVYQRDYAMLRLIYGTGIRMNECRMLDIKDVLFDHGTIHVRYGKGTNGSGRRERYVPIVLHGLPQVLEIYLKYCRPLFSCSDRKTALFLSERGDRISLASMKQRISSLQNLAKTNSIFIHEFSCHDLRRAFATHLYERDPKKIEPIRHMLGHSMLATTQRYLRPSSKFLEDQLQELTTGHLIRLLEGEPDA